MINFAPTSFRNDAWFARYGEVKRSYLRGARSRIDAINELNGLGFGFEARHVEVLEWTRERDAPKCETVLIIAFEDG